MEIKRMRIFTMLVTFFIINLLVTTNIFGERLGIDIIYSNTSTSSDRRAMPYTMTEDGEIYSVVMYHEGGSGLMQLAVYDNFHDGANNYPNNLVAVTLETGVNGSSGWQEIFLSTRYCASAGQVLWLAWVYQYNPGIRYTSGSPGRASSGEGWTSGMPSSFGSSSLTDYVYSINANYETGDSMQVCGSQSDCGNGVIDPGETCLNCPQDVGQCGYRIFYHANGATGGSVPVDNNNYQTGENPEVQMNPGNLVKTGYTFDGWNTQADGSGTAYKYPGNTLTIGTADVNLYAQWLAGTSFRVFYDANGATSGNVPLDPNPYPSGADATVLDNTGNLAQTGYTFNGWNTTADGNGTTYNPGEKLTLGSSNVTLYVLWQEESLQGWDYPEECGPGDSMIVDGKSKFNNNINLIGNLDMFGDFVTNSHITAVGDIISSSNLNISNNATINGYMGIGTTPSTSYRLKIDGGIEITGPFQLWGDIACNSNMDIIGGINVGGDVEARSFKVGDWTIKAPDYVFENDYNLRSLTEVEEFIQKNKHLPEIPNAKTMEKDGVDLAELNMLLLKKIEELTLYNIEQNKKIENLEKKIEELIK